MIHLPVGIESLDGILWDLDPGAGEGGGEDASGDPVTD